MTHRVVKFRLTTLRDERKRHAPALGTSAAAPRSAVGARLQTDHQEQVDDFKRVVGSRNGDRSATLRLGQQFRVFHRQRSSIREMDVERPEWLRQMQVAELLDGHVPSILPAASVTTLPSGGPSQKPPHHVRGDFRYSVIHQHGAGPGDGSGGKNFAAAGRAVINHLSAAVVAIGTLSQ